MAGSKWNGTQPKGFPRANTNKAKDRAAFPLPPSFIYFHFTHVWILQYSKECHTMVCLFPITEVRVSERQITYWNGEKMANHARYYTLYKRINGLYGGFHSLINPLSWFDRWNCSTGVSYKTVLVHGISFLASN